MPVPGETNPVRHCHLERRREDFHVIGDTVLVAVGHRVDQFLAGTDEGNDTSRPNGHMAGIGNRRIEADLEAVGNFYLGGNRLEGFDVLPGLRDRLHHRRTGGKPR